MSFDFQFENPNDRIAGSIQQYERDPSGILELVDILTIQKSFDDGRI